jgi:hypothetical protein
MYIEFNAEFDNIARSFASFTHRIQQTLSATYGLKETAALLGVTFDVDRTLVPQAFAQIAQFIVERRTEQPFADRHFFSRAPCQTSDHVALLEYFESLLSTQGSPSP